MYTVTYNYHLVKTVVVFYQSDVVLALASYFESFGNIAYVSYLYSLSGTYIQCVVTIKVCHCGISCAFHFYCCTDDRTHCIGYVTSNLLGLLHSLIRCDLGCESLLRGDAEKTQGSYTSKQLFSTFKVHTIFVSWLKQFGSSLI